MDYYPLAIVKERFDVLFLQVIKIYEGMEYNDDGTAWLYYKNQKIEITDKFKDDVCYVKVQDGDETLYVTVKYQNGLAYSNEKYVEEDEFN